MAPRHMHRKDGGNGAKKEADGTGWFLRRCDILQRDIEKLRAVDQ